MCRQLVKSGKATSFSNITYNMSQSELNLVTLRKALLRHLHHNLNHLSGMALRYFCALLGLCISSLFLSWGLRLKYTIQELERALELQKQQQSNDLDGPRDKNNTLKDPRPRILCWILTGIRNHMTKAIHVKRTWGTRCDKMLIMSTVEDPRIGSIATAQDYDELWPRTQKAFKYIWKHHKDDADWFLKADEDTFVLVDNLRKFVKHDDPSEPRFLGTESDFLKTVPPNNFGGAGFVLSKEAIRRFVDTALVRGGDCFSGYRPDYNGNADTALGLCLQSVGVFPEYPLDERGLPRFLRENPLKMFGSIHHNHKQLWIEVTWELRDNPSGVRPRTLTPPVITPPTLTPPYVNPSDGPSSVEELWPGINTCNSRLVPGALEKFCPVLNNSMALLHNPELFWSIIFPAIISALSPVRFQIKSNPRNKHCSSVLPPINAMYPHHCDSINPCDFSSGLPVC